MSELRASVVVATRDRSRSLVALLAALVEQTLPREQFEVIVVDDGSTDDTQRVLADAGSTGALQLRVLRDEGRGPAAARNRGWRSAESTIVAFTDDDCRPAPEWLERGLELFGAHPNSVVQGRVEKDPEQMGNLNPFAHWFEVHDEHQGFPTANIFYPRALLEQLGGFDESFERAAGEDTDLGWRAVEAGAEIQFASDALIWHAIVPGDPLAKLRQTARWTDTVRNYKAHPQMPKVKGVFWRHNHWELFRFLVALALPRWMGPVRLFLAAPYVKYLTDRRTGPLFAPYLLAVDTAEVLAIVRGAIRYRVFLV